MLYQHAERITSQLGFSGMVRPMVWSLLSGVRTPSLYPPSYLLEFLPLKECRVWREARGPALNPGMQCMFGWFLGVKGIYMYILMQYILVYIY